jgi:hypothetical protein
LEVALLLVPNLLKPPEAPPLRGGRPLLLLLDILILDLGLLKTSTLFLGNLESVLFSVKLEAGLDLLSLVSLEKFSESLPSILLFLLVLEPLVALDSFLRNPEGAPE